MVRPINVGELNVRFVIQNFSIEKDDVSNDPIQSWADVKTILAKELPTSMERFEAKQQTANQEVRLFMRSRSASGLNETMRLIRLRDRKIFYVNSIEDQIQGFAIVVAEKRDHQIGITADSTEFTADTTEVTADSTQTTIS